MDAIQICLLAFYLGMILAVLCIPIGLTILWIRISAKVNREKAAGAKVADIPQPKPSIITPLNPASSAKSIGSYLEYSQRKGNPLPKSARVVLTVFMIATAVMIGLMLLVMAAVLVWVVIASMSAA